MKDCRRLFFLAVFAGLALVLPFLYVFVNYITLSLIWNYIWSISIIMLITASVSISVHYLAARRYYFTPMMKPVLRYEKRDAVEKAYNAGQSFPLMMALQGACLFVLSMLFISFYLKYQYPGLSFRRLIMSFSAVAVTSFFIFLFEYIIFKRLVQGYYSELINKYDFFLDIQKEHGNFRNNTFSRMIIFMIFIIIIFSSFVLYVHANLESTRFSKRMLAWMHRDRVNEVFQDFLETEINTVRKNSLFDLIALDTANEKISRSTAFIDGTEFQRLFYVLDMRRTRMGEMIFIEDTNDRHFYLIKETENHVFLCRFDVSSFKEAMPSARINPVIIALMILILFIAGIFISRSYGNNFRILHDKIEAFNNGRTEQINSVISHTEFRELDFQLNMMIFRFREIFGRFQTIDSLIASINSLVREKLQTISGHSDTARAILDKLDYGSGNLENSMSNNVRISGELKNTAMNMNAKFSDFNPLLTKLSGDINALSGIISRDSNIYDNFYGEIARMHDVIGELFQISSDNSSGLTELDASIRQIQLITNEIQELAQGTYASSESGELVIYTTKDAIYQISRHFSNISGLIDNLGEKTSNIDFIIDVIHEIAKKTNLLSLNASIIASQSGEYGKSFLVVANEIHSLAEKTTVSIKSIEKMVGSIKETVESIAQALSLGKSTLESGLELIEKAGSNLRVIVDKAKATLDQIGIIYKSITEQSDSAHMITDNSQTIYDQLKIINENIDSVKELFSNALRYKTDLNDQNNSITRVFSKCAGNLSIFESDLKTLAVKIKALDSGISESYSASKAQGGVYEKLDSLYDRDRKRAEEIEVLIAEIEKISQALKDELGSLR